MSGRVNPDWLRTGDIVRFVGYVAPGKNSHVALVLAISGDRKRIQLQGLNYLVEVDRCYWVKNVVEAHKAICNFIYFTS